LREQLLALQTEIEKAERQVEQIPQYEKALQIARQQLTTLKTAKVEEIIDLKRRVAEERALREQVKPQLDVAAEGVGSGVPNIAEGLRELTAASAVQLGAAEFASILSAVDAYEQRTTHAATELRQQFTTLTTATAAQLQSWIAKEAEALRVIEVKRKDLEAQGLRLDMSYIEKLARDEASHQKSVVNLKTWIPHLNELRKRRADSLRKRWVARDKVATRRDAYARHASDILDRELARRSCAARRS
jgi:hypothetical protein